ncbi:MAG TPA: DUF1330 domain-containing protein [Devosiaceae bacterium]|jgi:uncharacterized protein (DUF1330 family)|nr:DUF1330 domain-containing protein [Devosiaceae bacterium]
MMKTLHETAIGVATAVGLVFAGALPVQAQAAVGPGYVVVELKVTDAAAFEEYVEKAPPTIEQYGGRFVVLAANAQTVEGAEPDGFVTVIRFDSVQAAQDWLTSPEYSAVKGLRHASATTRQLLVEGLPVD